MQLHKLLPDIFSWYYQFALQNNLQCKHVAEWDQADLFDSDQIGQQGSQNGN
jgi:hypothetical protein